MDNRTRAAEALIRRSTRMEFHSDSPEQTEAIAADFARSLKPGRHASRSHGDLGAGKTRFVRGLLRGLGGDVRAVSSPTFVLLNVYDGGRLAVYHLDAYRVGPDDLEAVGFAELLEQGGVVVVEWASRITELLPPGYVDVHLEAVGEESRAITIRRS